ncbi:MAG: flagellar biosynthetic protein FliO [Desulfurivibrionaceae bacterium]|nr:flagellar biosynthetic protein FliO [Pseudomonadota bacterium]MCG2824565.1 flagellar biosynthetic protein FliO [Desulfobulbaceae bacterium]MDP2003103.1 flagellar biosynthetic protein FliO [Desulfurivibrionaceae bacterium]PKN15959.1 MAG: hypothetical protein CVU68_12550 [Deltaproteobacteria bacterium HGW-Deltaproteobacteria-3]MBU4228780.1 flagellar biosynthetic protein FliO [Pseudomonadota bacterium]
MKIRQPSPTRGVFRATMLIALGASLLFHLACPFMLLAAERLTGNQEALSLTTTIFKTIGSLVLVVGLMLLLLAWIKKMGFAKGGSRQEGLITVLDSRMLAPKKQVSVLEVAGAYLVVGLSEQQITLLATLDPNERLMAATQKSDAPPLPASFAAMLHKATQTISGMNPKKKGSADAE